MLIIGIVAFAFLACGILIGLNRVSVVNTKDRIKFILI